MPDSPVVPTVTVTTVPEGAFLLDVREPDEWAAAHVDGALHVPLAQLPARVAELPRDRPVAALCRRGPRSEQATAFLRAQGVEAYNVDGGMTAWAQAGLPMVSENGDTPQVI